MNYPDPLHLLALSVVNIPDHYEGRVANHGNMTREEYEAYIRSLVSAEATRQYERFGVRWSCHSIDDAVRDVCQHMDAHCAEVKAAAVEVEESGVRAVIKLQSMLGLKESSLAARLSWQRMTVEQKSWTLEVASDDALAAAVQDAHHARTKP